MRKLAGAIAARRAATNFDAAAKLLGSAFQGVRTDTTPLRKLRGWVGRSISELSRCSKPELAARFWRLSAADLRQIESFGKVLEALRPLLKMQLDASADLRAVVLSQAIPDEYREMFAMVGDSANVLDLLDDMLLRAASVDHAADTVTSKTGLVEHLWLAKPRGEWTSADLLKRIDLAIVSPDQLDAWLTYDLERRRATGPLILGLVAAAETGGMPPDHLVLALDYLVFDGRGRRGRRSTFFRSCDNTTADRWMTSCSGLPILTRK